MALRIRKLFLTPFARPLCRSGQLRSSAQQLQHRFYRAAVLKKLGKPFSLEDVKETPSVSDQSVLVKVGCAGVNNADLAMQRGFHHAKLPLPYVAGFKFVGEVLKTGGKVQSVAVGDRVLGLMTESTGAFADECVAHKDEIHRMPHMLNYDIAASIPVAYGTALLALKRYADVKEGVMPFCSSKRGWGYTFKPKPVISMLSRSFITVAGKQAPVSDKRPQLADFVVEKANDGASASGTPELEVCYQLDRYLDAMEDRITGIVDRHSFLALFVVGFMTAGLVIFVNNSLEELKREWREERKETRALLEEIKAERIRGRALMAETRAELRK